MPRWKIKTSSDAQFHFRLFPRRLKDISMALHPSNLPHTLSSLSLQPPPHFPFLPMPFLPFEVSLRIIKEMLILYLLGNWDPERKRDFHKTIQQVDSICSTLVLSPLCPTTSQLGWNTCLLSFPGGAEVKRNLPTNAGKARDTGSVPGSGRSPGEGNGNSLWYSCLENCMDRGAEWVTVYGVSKSTSMSRTWLSTHTHP